MTVETLVGSRGKQRTNAAGTGGRIAWNAHATARWMADMASRGALAACFDPPLAPAERALAALEGWILGVR